MNPESCAALDPARLEQFSVDFNTDHANHIAQNAATSVGVLKAATCAEGMRNLPREFSVELKQGSITNQEHSGRCWMFGSLNVLRYELMHAWKLEDFEFSESYLYFWETIEKSNMYLERVLATLDEPSDSRVFQEINAYPGEDGGWYSLFAQLVEKYGLMPKSAYPEIANSKDSDTFKQYLKSKLREIAADLRARHRKGASAEELADIKEEGMKTMYRMVAIALGEPPKSFDFLVRREKDEESSEEKEVEKKKEPALGEVHNGTDERPQIAEYGITPVEFYKKYVPVRVEDVVTLANAPMERTPFGERYVLKMSGEVAGGHDVEMLNVELDEFKSAVLKQLQSGHPVTFSCDCMQFSLRKEGYFAQEVVQVDELFSTDFAMSKADGLEYFDSGSNHLMSFTGVNLDASGKPNRWKVENSWGKDAGEDGYYVMSDAWFDRFVCEADVRKEFLSEDVLALLEKKPIELEPWQPLSRASRCR